MDTGREQLQIVAEKAVLVRVELPGRYSNAEDPLGELRALAETAGAQVVGELSQKRSKPNGKTYLGKGKVQELAALVEMTEASLIVFDHDLSPKQLKEIEEATECKVVDRSELILDIFANRAATHAAKLQVEIAQLQYTYPRLRAMWSHLERIAGGAPVGIGTRGPGEKQLEIDRRIVQRRLAGLKRELEDVLGRKQREVEQRNTDHVTVGLVGYTNAGKSTLFNRLTEGGAYAHDKLFATLSTRVERWDVGGGNHVMLSDTVGFIRDLPHHLVASFRSTLADSVHAQLLIVVVDVSDPEARMQLRTVHETLDEIGADAQPRILVLNKVDLLPSSSDLLVWLNDHPSAMVISATTGEGLDALRDEVHELMLGGVRTMKLAIPMADGRTIDFVEKRTEVLDRSWSDHEAVLEVRAGRRHIDMLLARGASFTIDGESPQEALDRLWPEQAEDVKTPFDVPPHHRFAATSTKPVSGWEEHR